MEATQVADQLFPAALLNRLAAVVAEAKMRESLKKKTLDKLDKLKEDKEKTI